MNISFKTFSFENFLLKSHCPNSRRVRKTPEILHVSVFLGHSSHIYIYDILIVSCNARRYNEGGEKAVEEGGECVRL